MPLRVAVIITPGESDLGNDASIIGTLELDL